MIFKNNEEAISAIKSNLKINEEFVEMRECSDELKALVNGDDFIEELIENIEGIIYSSSEVFLLFLSTFLTSYFELRNAHDAVLSVMTLFVM